MKIFVLDTNVLLHDPEAIFSFEENDVFIPIVVLEELDKFKREQTDIGQNARLVMKSIDGLRKKGSLKTGVSLGDGLGCLAVISENIEFEFVGLAKSVDNYILGVTRRLAEIMGRPVILVTKDVNLRLKADAFGITAEDYRGKMETRPLALIEELETPDEIIDKIYERGSIPLSEAELGAFYYELLATDAESFILKGGKKKSVLVRCAGTGALKKLSQIKDPKRVAGIKPKNSEQRFLADMLLDQEIDMVACAGVAGSGKTLLSIACGLEMALKGTFDRVLITKAIQPVGADIGYVKGDKKEKMAEWLKPFYDNLELIAKVSGEQTLGTPEDNELIEVDALTYIRGRSLMSRFVIIDEVQNLPPRMLKTIVSRLSDTSKLVLLGDLQQIDNPYLDSKNNGLAYVMTRMRGCPGVGVLSMAKSERGRLARLAIDRL